MQTWKRTAIRTETDEQPHYFALKLQKSEIEFYRTLPKEPEIAMMEQCNTGTWLKPKKCKQISKKSILLSARR